MHEAEIFMFPRSTEIEQVVRFQEMRYDSPQYSGVYRIYDVGRCLGSNELIVKLINTIGERYRNYFNFELTQKRGGTMILNEIYIFVI